MKYFIKRYIRTVGTYLIIIAFCFSSIASFLIIFFTKLDLEKYYIVINPFVTVILTSIWYFIYKLEKEKPKISIKKEQLYITKENVELILKEKNTWSMWTIKNNKIEHFDYESFVNETKCFYAVITNTSNSSDLILKIYIKNKKINISKDLERLYPLRKCWLFLDRPSIIKIKYFNVEKYGRKDTHEF